MLGKIEKINMKKKQQQRKFNNEKNATPLKDKSTFISTIFPRLFLLSIYLPFMQVEKNSITS
jgi:hypothetical protein